MTIILKTTNDTSKIYETISNFSNLEVRIILENQFSINHITEYFLKNISHSLLDYSIANCLQTISRIFSNFSESLSNTQTDLSAKTPRNYIKIIFDSLKDASDSFFFKKNSSVLDTPDTLPSLEEDSFSSIADYMKLFPKEFPTNDDECPVSKTPQITKDFVQKIANIGQKKTEINLPYTPTYETIDGVQKIPLTNKQFAYLFGDLYILGSSLDQGLPIIEAKKTLNNLLKILPTDLKKQGEKFLEKIKTMPDNKADIYSAAKELALEIKNLPVGEDILLESGWNPHAETLWRNQKSGHYIITRWVKTKENTYDIYVYNLGSGVDYHRKEHIFDDSFPAEYSNESSLEVMQKDYYSPVLKIQGVKGEEIGLFPNKEIDIYLFDRLMKIKHEYNIQDHPLAFYLSTFRALHHKIVKTPTTEKEDILALPHLTGSCAWFTLFYAAFRSTFEDQKLWEKTEWQMKDFAFLSHCDSSTVTSNPEQKELCELAAKGLLRELAGLHGTIFSRDVVEKYQQRIESILSALQQDKAVRILEESYPILSYGNFEQINYERSKNDSFTLNNVLPLEIPLPFSSSFLDVKDTKNLKIELLKIINFPYKSLLNDLKFQIERLVKVLPSPRDFAQYWSRVSKKDARDNLDLLVKVFHLYASNALDKSERLLIEQNTAWTLLAAIYHFSTKINKDLENYGLFHQSFLDIIANPLFVGLNYEDQKIYQDLVAYFTSLPEKRLFKMPSSSGDLIDASCTKQTPDVEFLLPIIEADKTASKNFQKKLEEQKYVYGHSFPIFKEIPNLLVQTQLLATNHLFWETSWKNLYISLLRKSCYLAQLFNQKIKNFDPKSYFINSYVYTDTGLLLKNEALENEPCPLPYAEESFPKDSVENSLCIFSNESEGKENTVLTQENNTLSSKLETASCQKSLQPDLLLEYYENNLKTLLDVKNQNIFLFSLFKSYPSLDPLKEALERPEFVDAIRDFIQKGINEFLHIQKTQTTLHVNAALFFIQLARRIEERLPTFHMSFSGEINKLLQAKNLNSLSLKSIHRQRILQYLPQKNFLLSLKKEEIKNSTALREIVQSWLYLQSRASKNKDFQSFYNHAEASRFIYDLSPIWERLPMDFIKDIISETIPIDEKSMTAIYQEEQSPVYKLSVDDDIWDLDILRGTLWFNKEKITPQIEEVTTLESSSRYKFLFGESSFTKHKIGQRIFFKDGLGRTFRATFDDSYKNNIVKLEMLYQKKWYSHIYTQQEWDNEYNSTDLSTENLIKKWMSFKEKKKNSRSTLPASLLADHIIFSSQDALLSIDKDSNEVVFIDIKNPKSSIQKPPICDYKIIASLNPEFYQQIEAFEKKLWLVEKLYTDSSLQIEIPRYRSLNKKTLSFIKNEKGLSWSENPSYVLKKSPPNLLGRCSNYLFLGNGKKNKILVPLKDVVDSKDFAAHCTLDIADSNLPKETATQEMTNSFYQEPLNKRQKERFLFIEYDVSPNGDIIPINTEGTLFLAYIYLAQKEYFKALELFKSVFYQNEKKDLSHTSLEILQKLLNLSTNSYDQSVVMSAFGLHVALTLMKQNENISEEGLFQLQYRYAQGIEAIPHYLRLSQKQLQFLENLWPKEQEELNPWCSLIENNWNNENTAEEFLKIYNDFHNAESIEEKTFLNMKHHFYLTTGSNPLIKKALKAIRKHKCIPLTKEHLVGTLNPEIDKLFDIVEKSPIANEHVALMQCQESEAKHKIRKRKSPFVANSQQKLLYELQKIPEGENSFSLLDVYENWNTHISQEIYESSDKYLSKILLEKLIDSLDLSPEGLGEIRRWEELRKSILGKEKTGTSVYKPIKKQADQPDLGGKSPKQLIAESAFTTTPAYNSSIAKRINHLFSSNSRFKIRRLAPPILGDKKLLKGINPFLEVPNFKIPENQHFSNTYIEALFLDTPSNKVYESALSNGRKRFLEDLAIGKKKNANEVRFSLKPGVSCNAVLKSLEHESSILSQRLGMLENLILQLANTPPEDPNLATNFRLLTLAEVKPTVKIKDLISCFLKNETKSYLKLNPHLKKYDIIYLDYIIGIYLANSIELAQINKAIKTDNLQTFASILLAPTVYQAEEFKPYQRQFLVYEYNSGMKIRKEQADLIRTMDRERWSVTQLMMGGGKTSVIASNLLYLMGKSQKIAFFIAPKAQFNTLKENLPAMQHKTFNQKVIPIQLQRQDLTESTLEWVTEQFDEAISEGSAILTTRETVESLTLEFFDLLSKKVVGKKLELLFSLVRRMKLSGYALGDEIDILLNIPQEMNFPFGEKTFVSSHFVEITKDIFSLLISPEFKDQFKLEANQQAIFSAEELEMSLRKVMDKFFETHKKDLFLEESHRNQFLQFIFGEPVEEAFQAMLTERSQIKEYSDSVEKLSLIKHLVSDIFPVTFSKNTGEHYGRVFPSDKVGPYNGVDSPAYTEFGSPWEATAYHYQTALSKGITTSELNRWYELLWKTAKTKASAKGISIRSTKEAALFMQITNIPLENFSLEEHGEDALATINQNSLSRLVVETSTILHFVGEYKNFLRSTSHNFFSTFFGFDAFSGTPWNVPSFPLTLQNHFYPDHGTEGKVVDIFLRRCTKVHKAPRMELNQILKAVINNISPDKRNRISGFIDTAGFFKNESSLSVAQGILDYYAQDPRIQSVLFFHRPNQGASEVLSVLKKGSKEPIAVGGSTPEHLEKWGISADSNFVYYDQTHCEGTDIAQKNTAINIITGDHQMSLRTLAQGILRLRKYFDLQDVEIIIPEEESHHFSKKNFISPSDVILKFVDNQTILQAEHSLRSYSQQQIDDAIRDTIIEKILNVFDLSEAIKLFESYKNTFIEKKNQSLYEQFGNPENWDSSLKIIEDSIHTKSASLNGLFPSKNTQVSPISLNPIQHFLIKKLKEISEYFQRYFRGKPSKNLQGSTRPKRIPLEERFQEILAHAKQSTHLPGLSRYGLKTGLNTQLDVFETVTSNKEKQQKTTTFTKKQSMTQKAKIYTVAKNSEWESSKDLISEQLEKIQKQSQTQHQSQTQDQRQTQNQREIKKEQDNVVRKEKNQNIETKASTSHPPSEETAKEIIWQESFFKNGFIKNGPIHLYSLKNEIIRAMYGDSLSGDESIFNENILVSQNFIQVTKGMLNFAGQKAKHPGQILLVKKEDAFQAILLSTQEADWFKKYIKEKQPSHMWLVRPNGRPLIGPPPPNSPEISDILWQIYCYSGNIQGLLSMPKITLQKLNKLEKTKKNHLYEFLKSISSQDKETLSTLENYFASHKRDLHLLEDLIE